jgi:UDP-N-acetylglucosamine 4-epimerase
MVRLNGEFSWLVTGVAGFIGSNLLEELLLQGQSVVGMDNLSTGHMSNLMDVKQNVPREQWARFRFIEADICDFEACQNACKGVDYVLHQAALGSVPRSIVDPITSHLSNVTGFLNILTAARDENVKRFVYAASSSTYGDHQGLPKIEEVIGRPLSPYAATKLMNEIYAEVYSRAYGMHCVGLRYFNVFGRRQDPAGAYAAVIPRWFNALLKDESIEIFGDGDHSRDFCYVDNAIQANLLAAMASNISTASVYNVAVGERTSLGELFIMMKQAINNLGVSYQQHPIYSPARNGDVLHSLANIEKAKIELGYTPTHRLRDGLSEASSWYFNKLRSEKN